MASRPASASNPSGRSTCRFGSALRRISARKRLPSRWWDFGVPIMPYLGDPATPSSWQSPTTPTSR
jgi:hypothetical protein